MPNKQAINAQIIADLIATLAEHKPSSMVYCAAEPIPALNALADYGCRVKHVSTVDELHGLAHFELGVVLGFLEQRSLSEGIQLVGHLRNLYCQKIWLAVPTSANWNLTTLIGLGFKRKHCYIQGEGELCSYTYDIDHYNHKREWNTPKNWANPENWGKYWW